jgi:acetyltransferase-like isoleucine patch superfamily enzyme
VVCADRIELGPNTYVGIEALITDTDAHPACPQCRGERVAARVRPVSIGSQCFIGARAMVLKGVSLAPGTCVAAGSVLSSSSTPYEGVVAGAPARQKRPMATCGDHRPDNR